MNVKVGTLVLAASMIASSPVFADAADTQWIAQCMMDNRFEGKSTEIVQKYCECMNSKMSSSETRSISEWELSHVKEATECSAYAGWK